MDDHKQQWAATFDEKFTSVLDVQDALSNRALSELARQLVMTRYTGTPEAFDLYVQGRTLLDKSTTESVKEGIQRFEQALAKDHRFALAYSGLADSYFRLGPMSLAQLPPEEAMRKQKEAATRALEIDDALAEAHTSLAITKMFYYWEWDEAERELKRAIELYPSYGLAHRLYGAYLTCMGRFEEGISESTRALELVPSSHIASNTLAGCFFFARRYDEAIARYRETMKIAPKWYFPHFDIAQAYQQKSMHADALAELDKATELSRASGGELDPEFVALRAHILAESGKRKEAVALLEKLQRQVSSVPVAPHNFALIYAGLDDKDQVIHWLEKSYDERASQLIYLKVDPRFDNVRSYPRFLGLLQRIGLTHQGI